MLMSSGRFDRTANATQILCRHFFVDNFELRFPSFQIFVGEIKWGLFHLLGWLVPVSHTAGFSRINLFFWRFSIYKYMYVFLNFCCLRFVLPLPISGVISFLRFIRDSFFSSSPFFSFIACFTILRNLRRAHKAKEMTKKM